MDTTKSLQPLLDLQKQWIRPEEVAEIELYLGLACNQRSGLIDHPEAVRHFTLALKQELPEVVMMKVWMWRGNSQEQQGKRQEATKDYLRGLVAITAYQMPLMREEIRKPPVPISTNNGVFLGGTAADQEKWRQEAAANDERGRDYNVYHRRIRRQEEMQDLRYFFVSLVKTQAAEEKLDAAAIRALIGGLTPDPRPAEIIAGWLQGENPRPWK